MMGGKVSLRSEVGMGSTFCLLFPDIQFGEKSRTEATVPDVLLSAFEPVTILIADDSEMNRELVSGYFEGTGHRLLFATNGREAVEMARSEKPALILMDMRMPVMDGYTATVEIKSIEGLSETPVLAVTASTLKEGETRIRQVCDAFIRKPFSQSDLSREMLRFLKLRPETVAAMPPVDMAEPETERIVRERWPELAEILAREHEQVWPSLCQTLTVRRISQFGGRLQQWGEEYGAPLVRCYGEMLERQSQEFDLDHLPKTLAKFPEIITTIKNT
jgi:CheY-like chemotaxis protein